MGRNLRANQENHRLRFPRFARLDINNFLLILEAFNQKDATGHTDDGDASILTGKKRQKVNRACDIYTSRK